MYQTHKRVAFCSQGGGEGNGGRNRDKREICKQMPRRKMACVDQLNVPWTDKCGYLNKNFFNERDGKIELPAVIPSEKPNRPMQCVQGKLLCLNHSRSSSPGTRMDEWESVFRINPGNFTSIVLSPPPQGLTWPEIIYRGVYPKTSDPVTPLLITAIVWHRSPLQLYIHSLPLHELFLRLECHSSYV